MKLRTSDVRALAILAVGIAALVAYRSLGSGPAVVASAESPDVLELRLAKLRRVAATVPGKQQALKQVQGQLQTRETGIMVFSTGPQAQAHLLEIARRIGSANKIEARGADFSAPHLLGQDYGEVTVIVNFECTIDQFVNFLSDLSRERELIAPSEVHIAAGNQKNKTINVRMTLSGVVPRKLVPEKKGSLLL